MPCRLFHLNGVSFCRVPSPCAYSSLERQFTSGLPLKDNGGLEMNSYQKISVVAAAICVLGAVPLAVQAPEASADPTIAAEPTYCTATGSNPAAGPRRDGKDTVVTSVDIRCDQAETVEWIVHISGDGNTWSHDIVQQVPLPPATTCPPQPTPCGINLTTDPHKVGGDLNGQIYTVQTTIKVWAGRAFCQDSQHCYPFGTPLRTFTLPDISAAVYD